MHMLGGHWISRFKRRVFRLVKDFTACVLKVALGLLIYVYVVLRCRLRMMFLCDAVRSCRKIFKLLLSLKEKVLVAQKMLFASVYT